MIFEFTAFRLMSLGLLGVGSTFDGFRSYEFEVYGSNFIILHIK